MNVMSWTNSSGQSQHQNSVLRGRPLMIWGEGGGNLRMNLFFPRDSLSKFPCERPFYNFFPGEGPPKYFFNFLRPLQIINPHPLMRGPCGPRHGPRKTLPGALAAVIRISEPMVCLFIQNNEPLHCTA